MAEFAQTPEGSIAYSDEGNPDGTPLVLLPGFQSSRSGWRVPNDYVALLPGFRVLLIDPLGHGKSTMSHDEGHYTAAKVVEHVVAVLDAASVDAAHIWGFSRGGLIAAACAEMVPARCRSAVLGASPIGDANYWTMEQLTNTEPLLAAGDWAAYWDSFPGPLPEEMKERFQRTNDPLALAAAIRSMVRWTAELPQLGLAPSDVPRLAYFGVGEVWADRQRAALAEAPYQVIEAHWAGHAETMLDADGVVARVLPFLQGVDAPSN